MRTAPLIWHVQRRYYFYAAVLAYGLLSAALWVALNKPDVLYLALFIASAAATAGWSCLWQFMKDTSYRLHHDRLDICTDDTCRSIALKDVVALNGTEVVTAHDVLELPAWMTRSTFRLHWAMLRRLKAHRLPMHRADAPADSDDEARANGQEPVGLWRRYPDMPPQLKRLSVQDAYLFADRTGRQSRRAVCGNLVLYFAAWMIALPMVTGALMYAQQMPLPLDQLAPVTALGLGVLGLFGGLTLLEPHRNDWLLVHSDGFVLLNNLNNLDVAWRDVSIVDIHRNPEPNEKQTNMEFIVLLRDGTRLTFADTYDAPWELVYDRMLRAFRPQDFKPYRRLSKRKRNTAAV